jgi:hypothetical protein
LGSSSWLSGGGRRAWTTGGRMGTLTKGGLAATLVPSDGATKSVLQPPPEPVLRWRGPGGRRTAQCCQLCATRNRVPRWRWAVSLR